MFGSKLDKVAKATEKKHVNELIKFTQDKDASVVAAALAGLGKIADDDAFNALIPFLSNADATYRAAAASALGEQGNAHGKAFLLHAAAIEKEASVKEAMEQASMKLKNY